MLSPVLEEIISQGPRVLQWKIVSPILIVVGLTQVYFFCRVSRFYDKHLNLLLFWSVVLVDASVMFVVQEKTHARARDLNIEYMVLRSSNRCKYCCEAPCHLQAEEEMDS